MFEHWGETIYWDAMSWDAFAGLVTGLAAVGGAVVIGFRQMRILGRQADLQHLTLRHELFDRRYKVYDATAAWIAHILQTGNIPNRPRNEGVITAEAKAERERQRVLEADFLAAIDVSRFLFSPQVFGALEQFWLQGNLLHYHGQARGGRDGQKHIDAEAAIHRWFADQRLNFSLVFGDEMVLGDGGQVTFREIAKPPEPENGG